MATNTLTINEATASYLLSTTNKRVEEIERQINTLKTEKDHLTNIISQLTSIKKNVSAVNSISFQTPAETSVDGYTPKWTWTKKIDFVLQKKGRPLTTTEIVDTLLNEYEPNSNLDRSRVVASISATLSMKSKDDENRLYSKSKNEGNEYVYSIYEKEKEIVKVEDLF
jgi:hypothetical protein